MTFLTFPKHPANPRRVTSIWDVRSAQSNDLVGQIKWHAPWRKYCFFTAHLNDALFDATCLQEIVDFIREAMLDRDPAKKYQPTFGNDKICTQPGCGHPYHRHFDWGEDYRVGCKYCICMDFKETKVG